MRSFPEDLGPSKPISNRLWWLPVIMLFMTFPVWSGRYEPDLFYWLNSRLGALPALFWSLFCLLGTVWCVIALTAFAVASALYFSTSPRFKVSAAWLFVAAIGVAVSRVAVGAHWPADVVVGASLGVFSGQFGAKLSQLIPSRCLMPQSGWMRGLAGVALIGVYVLATDTMGFAQNLPWQYGLCVFLAMHIARFLFASSRTLRTHKANSQPD